VNASLEKPKTVTLAVKIILASIAVGTSKALLLAFLADKPAAQRLLQVVFTLLAISPFLLVVYKISLGRNWARVVLLLFTAMGLYSSGRHIWLNFSSNPIVSSVDLALCILQIVAIGLLFAKSSKVWFVAEKPI